MVVNIFNIYIGACVVNMILGLTIQYKIESILDKERISYKAFKNTLENNSEKNEYVKALAYSYSNEFLEVIVFSCVPVLHLFSTYMYLKVTCLYKKHLANALELIDLYKAKNQLNKLKQYDNSNFYDNLSKLLSDDSFEYKDIIIKSLNMLIQYVQEYEGVKLLSDKDKIYKKELGNKLNESISKFKEVSKELITLHNKNNYDFNDLNKFNSLLDNIIDDIKSQKAIFIEKKQLD